MAHPLQSEQVPPNDLTILLQLDAGYVRSAEASDARWYAENLAEDFLASINGALVDRAQFLARMTGPYSGSKPKVFDVRIRCFKDLALIHAGFRYLRSGGEAGCGRYTNIYARRKGRWVCVAAHINCL